MTEEEKNLPSYCKSVWPIILLLKMWMKWGFHEKQWGTKNTPVGSVGTLNWKRKCINKKQTKTSRNSVGVWGRGRRGCLFHLEVPRILTHSPWFCWLQLGDKADGRGAHGKGCSHRTWEEAENKEGPRDPLLLTRFQPLKLPTSKNSTPAGELSVQQRGWWGHILYSSHITSW